MKRNHNKPNTVLSPQNTDWYWERGGGAILLNFIDSMLPDKIERRGGSNM